MKNQVPTTKHGYVAYPKGDVGRLVNIMKAIVSLDKPTHRSVAECVGLSRAAVTDGVRKLNTEFLAEIVPTRDRGFQVEAWGVFLSPELVRRYDAERADHNNRCS